MSRYLGIVNKLCGGFTIGETNMFVYDTALVVSPCDADYGLVGIAIGGVIGGVAGERLNRNKKSKQAATVTPEHLASLNAKARLIQVSEVRTARVEVSRGLGGRRTLVMEMADGRVEQVKWQKGVNKDRDVLPMLRHALGHRLAA